jgi:hypothetical protein
LDHSLAEAEAEQMPAVAALAVLGVAVITDPVKTFKDQQTTE